MSKFLNIASYIAGAIVIIAIGFFGVQFLTKSRNFSTNNQTTNPQPTPGQVLNLINQDLSIKAPLISKEESIAISEVPSDLQALFPNNGLNVSTAILTFENGTKGYRAEFRNSQDVLNNFRSFSALALLKMFTTIENQRGDDSGVMLLKKSGFVYKIEMVRNKGITYITITSFTQ